MRERERGQSKRESERVRERERKERGNIGGERERRKVLKSAVLFMYQNTHAQNAQVREKVKREGSKKCRTLILPV